MEGVSMKLELRRRQLERVRVARVHMARSSRKSPNEGMIEVGVIQNTWYHTAMKFER